MDWDGKAFFAPADGGRRLDARRMPELLRRCCVDAYRWHWLRRLVRALVLRMEGGLMFSLTWREIARIYHQVEFGLYSYSPGLKPGDLPPGTKVGRFCSLGSNLTVLRRNHPIEHPSQHPLFYLRRLGLVAQDVLPPVEANPLVIGHDVWIGDGVVILPGCKSIGNGAVIGARSVVTRDVPPFTVVAGSPAKPLRKRFPAEVEAVVARSEWWLRPPEDLAVYAELFTQPLAGQRLEQFRATFVPGGSARKAGGQ